MTEFIQTALSGPAFPATILLMLICAYWLLIILGAFDLDFLDVEVDFDAEAHGVMGAGFVVLKFLNIGRVPFMLWLSVFSLAYWGISMLWRSEIPATDYASLAAIMLRNGGLAVIVAKLVTNPLSGKFDPIEPNRVRDLLGRSCTVVSLQADESSGQVEVASDGAPLRLQVRTTTGTMHKGDLATLVDHDPQAHIFWIQPAETEEPS